MPDPTDSAPRDVTRARIVTAAAELLATGGREAVTTRAVAAAADVQAPTIYRLFGDMRGLLDAVVANGFASHFAGKLPVDEKADPLTDLRDGWDQHIAFGLANPALYALMAGDPRPDATSPAEQAAEAVLRRRLHRLAAAGRLRVSLDEATLLITAVGRGTVLTLLGMPHGDRDGTLAVKAREAVIAAITTDTPAVAKPGPAAAANALKAMLPDATALTEGERRLLSEWLDRLAD